MHVFSQVKYKSICRKKNEYRGRGVEKGSETESSRNNIDKGQEYRLRRTKFVKINDIFFYSTSK